VNVIFVFKSKVFVYFMRYTCCHNVPLCYYVLLIYIYIFFSSFFVSLLLSICYTLYKRAVVAEVQHRRRNSRQQCGFGDWAVRQQLALDWWEFVYPHQRVPRVRALRATLVGDLFESHGCLPPRLS